MDNTHSLRVQCIALRQVMLVNAAKLLIFFTTTI